MKNKKILIGVGVVGALGLAYYFYNRIKKSSTTSDSGDTDSSKNGSGVMPSADPISDTVADTPKKAVEESSMPSNSDEIRYERRPMPVTPPSNTRPPVAAPRPAVMPTAPRPTVMPTATRPSLTLSPARVSTVRLSRFSGFDGGGNYVEVGEQLTDLN